MVITFGDAFTVAQSVYSHLTKEQQKKAAWYEATYQLAQRTQLACNNRNELEDTDEHYFDIRPNYNEFDSIKRQARSLLQQTDSIPKGENVWIELRKLENEIQDLLLHTTGKERRPPQERPKVVYDRAQQVMETCEIGRENLGIGTAIRDRLS